MKSYLKFKKRHFFYLFFEVLKQLNTMESENTGMSQDQPDRPGFSVLSNQELHVRENFGYCQQAPLYSFSYFKIEFG